MLRFARELLVPFAYAVGAAAAALATVAGNAATGSPVSWLPSMNQHPLRWLAASIMVAAAAGLFGWWAPRRYERTLRDQVPAPQLPESWVVQRPAEVGLIVRALCRRASTVGVTTAVRGAGGFGKSTVARMVRSDRRVLRRFGGRVHWVTLGRDARRGALVEKVNDLVRQIAPDRVQQFTDVQQAADHLAAVIAAGPRRLVIVDDVWFDDQLAAFPVAGRSARLVTTRTLTLTGRSDIAVRVDHMTDDQARTVLTADLPPLPAELVDALITEAGRWPLLLRLINKILADQCRLRTDSTAVGRELLHRIRDGSALQVDALTGVAGRPLDVGDPDQRRQGVAATIEASTGLLTADERSRFAELAIFAEDETIPVGLVAALWQATGAMDTVAARALCARLGDLALLTLSPTGDGGAIGLHDVIRDYLRDGLGTAGLRTANDMLLTAVAGDPPLGWWRLPESARYLRDHLIGHLQEAGRADEAAATASDLRWITARLEHSGPNAPYTDLIEAGCERLGRSYGQIAHLLGPTVPAHSRTEILYCRVAHEPSWRDQVERLTVRRKLPALVSRWPLPDLPHPDLRRTIAAYAAYADALVVAPDGSWLATTAIHGPVRIWDVATGEMRFELPNDIGRHPAIVMAPDGSWLATSGDRWRVQIWDTATGELRLQRETGGGTHRTLVVAPDGSWLAAASEHGATFVWDLATGDLRFAPLVHDRGVSALTAAPDGSWLATTAIVDGTARIWDAATGQLRAETAGPISTAVVSVPAPDGSWLATADTRGTVRVWDTATGELRADLVGHDHYVGAAAVAPDGSWLAVGDDSGALWIWDPATGKVRARLTGQTHFVRTVVVSADGSWLASASGNVVRTWNAATGELRAELLGHAGPVRALAMAPDGTWLASTGNDGSVRIWDAATGGPYAGTSARGGVVCGMALAPDGSWLAGGGDDGLIRLWDVASGEQRTELGGHREHRAVGMPEEGTPIDEIPSDLTLQYEPTNRPCPVIAVVAAPDGTWLASTAQDDPLVRIWEVAGDRELRTLGDPEAGATQLAVAPDGSWLAAASYRAVMIWDVVTGELRARLTVTGRALAMAAAPDGSWLASLHGTSSVLIWDLTTGERRFELTGHTAVVCAVAVAADGSWLVSGDAAGSLRIWDTATGRQRAELNGHAGDSSAVAISPDGSRVASAGADGSLRIWEVRGGEPIAMMRVNAPVTACVWTPDGRSVVVGGAGGLYRFSLEAA